MRIDIHANGFSLTESIQTHLQRRIAFALNRLSGRIRRVSVKLSDINGNRGGIDKRCQLQVQLKNSPDVVVSDVQRDLYSAMTRAIDRAAAATVRRLDRLPSRARGSLSRPADRPVPLVSSMATEYSA